MKTLLVLLLAAASAAAQQSYDLVVYGGSAGGVMTAVAGARQGLKVALVNPGRHIGGLVSGGRRFGAVRGDSCRDPVEVLAS